MDRALDAQQLASALGELRALPTPEEMANLLGDAELRLLMRKPELDPPLLRTGWCLFAAATSPSGIDLYGVSMQRAALQVAGHVFDLHLDTVITDTTHRLRTAFAAQVAYLLSELDPNALAVARRALPSSVEWPQEVHIVHDCATVSLLLGVATLALNTRFVDGVARMLEDYVSRCSHEWDIDVAARSVFGPSIAVCRGCHASTRFLESGDDAAHALAVAQFERAESYAYPHADPHAKWVASLLRGLAEKLRQTSIWKVLPSTTPVAVTRAFTMGSPRALTLWPPQLEFLRGNGQGDSPFSAGAKRLFLSTPTSGGKTMLAQMLILEHIASHRGKVCYVAPTRSLCAEVRKSLAERLRFTMASYGEGSFAEAVAEMQESEDDDVSIMTPEGLNARIRSDLLGVLSTFSMFVFDEAHCVGDQGRGWIAEETITLLHASTLNTTHRIVLISAVVGNRAHFIEWLSNGAQRAHEYHSTWRGPRRVTGIWHTAPDFTAQVCDTTANGALRKTSPLNGQLTLRLGHEGRIRTLKTASPIGTLVIVRQPGQRAFKRDTSTSTTLSSTIPDLVDNLLGLGTVLVIAATRASSAKYAKAIAARRADIDTSAIQGLLDLVAARLSEEHPLFTLLKRGVAYHHGALPIDVRSAIEEAASAGKLQVVVATTTMTEGINLPVKSVVLAELGTRTSEGYVEFITGSRLANAIGRAGRSAKETEGIVVLAMNEQVTAESFAKLDVSPEDMHVTSLLATTTALNELAALETAARGRLDAIIETQEPIASGFVSFVWQIASLHDAELPATITQRIMDNLSRSLASVQAPREAQEIWRSLAHLVTSKYIATTSATRMRWAKSGHTISAARLMEQMADEITAEVLGGRNLQNAHDALACVLSPARQQVILCLPSAPTRRVFNNRAGRGRQEIALDLVVFLQSWISGVELHDLAQRFLGGVRDVDFRFEQLSDFTTAYCEHFLPGVLRTLVEWINQRLTSQGCVALLPRSLPGYVRWGVDSDLALRMMVSGLRSRVLARKVATAFAAASPRMTVQKWIGLMSVADIVSTFRPNGPELRDLLECVRRRHSNLVCMAASNTNTTIRVQALVENCSPVTVVIRPIEDLELSPLGVYREQELLGRIQGRDQIDIQVLLDAGLSFQATFSARQWHGQLDLTFGDSSAYEH